jgi:putative ATP-dependent endonuclease of OLD family
LKTVGVLPAQVAAMRVHLDRFRSGDIDFPVVRTEMLTAFPGDRINTIFATL